MTLSRRINPNGDFSVWQLGEIHSPAKHGEITADSYYWHDCGSHANQVKIYKSPEVPFLGCVRQSLCIENIGTPFTAGDSDVGGLVLTLTSDAIQGALRNGFLTFSRWVKSTVPGSYSIGIRSNGGPLAETSQNESDWTFQTHSNSFYLEANVWKFVSFVVPMHPYIDFGAGGQERGLALFMFLDGGSKYYSPQGIWSSGPRGVCEDQVPWFQTPGAKMWVAACQVEAEVSPTGFESQKFMNELWDCQKFIQTSFEYGVKPASGLCTLSNILATPYDYFTATRKPGANSNGWQGVQVRFNQTLITKPSLTLFNPIGSGAAFYNWSRNQTLGGSFDNISRKGFRASAEDNNAVCGDSIFFGWVANASVLNGGAPAYRV